jgi:alkane 1-monooxygenase
MKTLGFVLHWIVPATAAISIALGGAWLLLTPIVLFGLLPLLDELSLDTENPDDETTERRLRNPFFDLLLFAWVPLEIALLAFGLYKATLAASVGEAIGIVSDLGLALSVVGINIAHELMHRAGRLHQAAAELLMTLVSYPHFCIEHVLGHHRNVATEADPASSRLGESVYAFLPRTVFGGLVSAWRLEGERVARRGRRLADRRIRMPLLLAALYGAVALVLGGTGVLALLGTSFVAILVLEVINYVEHYGLERRLLEGGVRERVTPKHSWNAAQSLSGALLLALPRHADHHANASRPFQVLRHLPEAPQLPFGYATMLLVALVPPLWRRLMDPRVAEWRREGCLA